MLRRRRNDVQPTNARSATSQPDGAIWIIFAEAAIYLSFLAYFLWQVARR
jgi:hypothetical protein